MAKRAKASSGRGAKKASTRGVKTVAKTVRVPKAVPSFGLQPAITSGKRNKPI
jgi:hypothetical protein